MEYLTSLYAIIESGLKLEIENNFKIKDNEIIVELADNTIASISLIVL